MENRKKGSSSKEHLASTIINISESGACIEIERVHLNGEHIFFTSMEGGDNFLYLRSVPLRNGSKDVAAIAVWMDKEIGRDRRFCIGMKFLEPQKELYSYLKKNRILKNKL